MSPISDQELQRHLARRTSKAMPADDREDVLAAVASARARPRFSWRMRPSLLLAPIAAIVLVVIVGVPLLWTLGPGPGPSPSPSSGPVTIYSAQQLSDMIGDPAWIGHYVLGRAELSYIRGATQCVAPDPCLNAYMVGVPSRNLVSVDWRDARQGAGVHLPSGEWVQQLSLPAAETISAFKILNDSVDFLGPANLASGGAPMTTAGARSLLPPDPLDDVYVVSGWFTEPLPPGCPTTPPGDGDPSWACDGSWLTPTDQRVTAFSSPTDGLHTQNGAYADFAPDPLYDDRGPVPRFGTYLVRPAGTAQTLEGRSQVWRMIGRLDQAISPAPSESNAASPSASASPSPTVTPWEQPEAIGPLQVFTAAQLSDMIGVPGWLGRVVLAETELTAPSTWGLSPCSAPSPCPEWEMVGGNRNRTVARGWLETGAGQYAPLELPQGEGVFAFRIALNWAEYLGPAITAADWSPLSPAEIPSSTATNPSADVYVVSGWLVRTEEISCPAPPSGEDLAYYCAGSSITATPTAITENPLFFAGGLHVQLGAYDSFALNPSQIEFKPSEYVSTSDQAVYLVRPIGTRGTEPNAWWMLGRIDPPLTYASDDLLVDFCTAPDQAAISALESQYGLSLYADVSGNQWVSWFKITDGVDAFAKQPLVADDPAVCNVELHWIGTAGWPSWASPTAAPR